jgi:hypothetical protein
MPDEYRLDQNLSRSLRVGNLNRAAMELDITQSAVLHGSLPLIRISRGQA